MKPDTFYLTFGVGSILRNVLIRIKAESRQEAIDIGKEWCRDCFCEAYNWDDETAKEKAKARGLTIVNG